MSIILAFVILCIAIKGPPEMSVSSSGSVPKLVAPPIPYWVAWFLCLLIPAAMILVLEKGWPL